MGPMTHLKPVLAFENNLIAYRRVLIRLAIQFHWSAAGAGLGGPGDTRELSLGGSAGAQALPSLPNKN